MSSRKKMKANIHMSKPELPPFLQKMREKIVANEDADRKERGEQRRKNRAGAGRVEDDEEDDPRVVKINDDDITEEEYKRMKLELETQYKLDTEASSRTGRSEELNIDKMIEIRRTDHRKSANDQRSERTINKSSRDQSDRVQAKPGNSSGGGGSSLQKSDANKKPSSKKLSYGSSEEEEDDD